MINTLLSRWSQFKKQWLAIFYICITQPIFMFQLSLYMQLATPWNYITATIASITVIVVMSLMFLFPKFAAQALVLQYENKPLPSSLFRPFSWGWFALISFVYMLAWYFDWYGLSNYWYFVMYVHSLVICYLLYKSTMQYINETK